MSLVTLDFESFYDTDYSLSKMTTEEYIRNSRFQSIGFAIKHGESTAEWFTGSEAYQTKILREVDWSQSAQLGHNNRFDAAILNWRFGCTPKFYLDTMSMARGLVGLATSCSLAKLGEYFQLPVVKGHEVVNAKGMRREDFTPDQLAAYGRYCANDTEMCFMLAKILMPRTLADELKLQDWTIRAYVEPAIILDRQALDEELAAYHRRKNALLHDAGILDVAVLRSDDTMARFLEQLGVDPPTKLSPKQKNADGSPKRVWAFSKSDIDFMDLLLDEDEKVVSLVEARLGTKSSIVQSRLERLIGISTRGPMPAPMVYAGATPTRRWSGDENINIQNFPRSKMARDANNQPVIDPATGEPVIIPSPLRRSLTAPPGFRMAAADLSQIELRVNAWQSGQHDVLDILRNGGDVYSDQATALYGYEITKKSGKSIHAVERFVGKTTELQCGYQCGAAKFVHSLKVAAKRDGMVLPDTSEEFGQRIVNGYREKRSKIKRLWYIAGQGLEKLAYGMDGEIGPYPIKDAKIWLPNGSYLYYPELRFEEKQGEDEQGCEWVYTRYLKGRMVRKKIYGGMLVENITQAVARLFVSDALLRLDSIRYANGERVFKVVFSVHDELVVLFRDHLDEKYVRAALEWAMTLPQTWAPDLPLACEIGIGQNYAECK